MEYNVEYTSHGYQNFYCMAWCDLATARAALATFVRLYGDNHPHFRNAFIVRRAK